MLRRSITMFIGCALTLLSPSFTLAAPDPEAARLIKLRDAERYFVKTPKSAIEAGAARIHVRNTLSSVRSAVLSYSDYPRFISKFSKARVVGKNGDTTDVYLQVPILKGIAKIWAVVRFAPITKVGDDELLVGHLVQGNVERLDVTWRLRSIDDQNTQLNLEMLIVPKIPAPAKVVAGEVAYAADEAVVGIRDRAESLRQVAD